MRFLRVHGLKLLLAAGLIGVVALINHVGGELVLQTLLRAGRWLPLLLLLEALVFSADAWALAAFYGKHGQAVPARQWWRSGLLHYATMVALPAGRAGAEAARATVLAPYVGGARSGAGALQVQCVTLMANTFISLACWLVLASIDLNSVLGWFVLANGMATLALGGGLYAATRQLKVGCWLSSKFGMLKSHGPEVDRVFQEAPAFPVRALVICCAGRTVQTLQYGVILLAVGGEFGVQPAMISQGIHLVGAALGDLIPNQVGATEAAYGLFSAELGVTAAAGVSIALIARINQFSLAGLCFLLAAAMSTSRVQEHPAE